MYLVACVTGMLTGYVTWYLIWQFIGTEVFPALSPSDGILHIVGLIGAVYVAYHFIKGWGFYRYLQALKAAHRRKFWIITKKEPEFLESPHTFGDKLFSIAFIVAAGIVPWFFDVVAISIAVTAATAAFPWRWTGVIALFLSLLYIPYVGHEWIGTALERLFNIDGLQVEVSEDFDVMHRI